MASWSQVDKERLCSQRDFMLETLTVMSLFTADEIQEAMTDEGWDDTVKSWHF